MTYSITQSLYEMMLDNRIISDVAREIGFSEMKLSSELRPNTTTAKLGANDLVAIFDALRKLGYAYEAQVIINSFIRELKGCPDMETGEYMPQFLSLCTLTGELAKQTAEIGDSEDEKEWGRIEFLIKTKIQPTVIGLQCTVYKKRCELRKKRNKRVSHRVQRTVRAVHDDMY